jgi:hypothetical protein
MLRQATKKSLLILFFLIISQSVWAAVVEQLLVVINGEPYTLSSLSTYAKTKMGRAFPTGNLDEINADDRQVLEQFITDKLLEGEVRGASQKKQPPIR